MSDNNNELSDAQLLILEILSQPPLRYWSTSQIVEGSQKGLSPYGTYLDLSILVEAMFVDQENLSHSPDSMPIPSFKINDKGLRAPKKLTTSDPVPQSWDSLQPV